MLCWCVWVVVLIQLALVVWTNFWSSTVRAGVGERACKYLVRVVLFIHLACSFVYKFVSKLMFYINMVVFWW